MANAVYHRAYDVREPIEVRIESEKIEIVSFPGPVRSVTQEQLKNYQVSNRRYRNRRIGEFLKELHLTEGRNTGFKKILDAINANGSPLPEFETDEDHTYFISRFYVHNVFQKNSENNQTYNNVGINVGINDVLAERMHSASEMRKQTLSQVLSIIGQNPRITALEIAQQIGLTTRTVERYLHDLQSAGLITREGARKNGQWKITFLQCNQSKTPT